MKYLSAEQVLFIHSRIIDMTGGAHGVLDVGLLLSAVSRARATFEGRDLYPDIFHKAAALMESLSRNHPFIDGNKRTAITAAGEVSFDAAVAWFRRHTPRSVQRG